SIESDRDPEPGLVRNPDRSRERERAAGSPAQNRLAVELVTPRSRSVPTRNPGARAPRTQPTTPGSRRTGGAVIAAIRRTSTLASLVVPALLVAVGGAPAAAQGPPLDLPRPSPAASVSQRVGL